LGNKEDVLWKLYGMIADINTNEISDQISRDNLSMWCNTRRITCKEIVRLIEKHLTDCNVCDTLDEVENSTENV
jgi:hypothetical protein